MAAVGRTADTDQRLPPTGDVLTARVAGLLALAAGTFAIIVLHAVQPGLTPASSRLSQYATGPYGWLMTVAFLSLAVGVLALALPWLRSGGWLLRLMGVLAVAVAAGLVVSAVYPTGVSASAEAVHSAASTLATVGLTAIAGALSVHQVEPAGGVVSRALAAGAIVLLVASPWLHETRFTGLGQRLLWLLLVAWLFGALRRV